MGADDTDADGPKHGAQAADVAQGHHVVAAAAGNNTQQDNRPLAGQQVHWSQTDTT
jgi:hypothetical protein